MEGSNPLLPQHSPPTTTFGGTANALARLGRPLPGPFAAHFASPIAPYTMPAFAGGPGGGAGSGQPQNSHPPPPPSLFGDGSSATASAHHLHSTLASMAAYSFDSLLSANFNNFANLLMLGPNNPGVGLGALQPPSLLSAFGGMPGSVAAGHPHHHHHQQAHSPSPTSTHSSPSPNTYFRSRDTPSIESKSGTVVTTTNNNISNSNHSHNQNKGAAAAAAASNHHGGSPLIHKTSASNRKGKLFLFLTKSFLFFIYFYKNILI